MRYLTYFGNHLIDARLPADARVLYPRAPLPGIARADLQAAVRRALLQPLDMPPLPELVKAGSKVLIAFDDNCQPFPPTRKPDLREVALEAILDLLAELGVRGEDIRLVCAVALHRKMKPQELRAMLGERVMSQFWPARLRNFDAEDKDQIADLGTTERGEPVEVDKAVLESDLCLYLDTVQIPLNGGHKSVAVGLAGYRAIAAHHAPQATADSPHVMQPEGSAMHGSIERMSRVIGKRARILVLEMAMNNEMYPAHLRHLGRPPERLRPLERLARRATPVLLKALPEPARAAVFRSIRSDYLPIEVNAGAIDAVHRRTLSVLRRQLEVEEPGQYSTLVFGLPDLSPYSVGARVNPVLVVSDVLGYVFNWFYQRPLVRPGGAVIILNPAYEVFHPEYHVAYRRFYDEVLAATHDPFEMQKVFQERFAADPYLIDCYRNRYAHHGFHPFTVWYWATYPLRYLSAVILVGPKDDRVAKRLGVSWASSLDRALAMARERTGGADVVALTIPPFFYTR